MNYYQNFILHCNNYGIDSPQLIKLAYHLSKKAGWYDELSKTLGGRSNLNALIGGGLGLGLGYLTSGTGTGALLGGLGGGALGYLGGKHIYDWLNKPKINPYKEPIIQTKPMETKNLVEGPNPNLLKNTTERGRLELLENQSEDIFNTSKRPEHIPYVYDTKSQKNFLEDLMEKLTPKKLVKIPNENNYSYIKSLRGDDIERTDYSGPKITNYSEPKKTFLEDLLEKLAPKRIEKKLVEIPIPNSLKNTTERGRLELLENQSKDIFNTSKRPKPIMYVGFSKPNKLQEKITSSIDISDLMKRN